MTESRRLHERYEVALPVTLIEGTSESRGTTVNVSLGGMLIDVGRTFAFGTSLLVRVELPGLKEPASLPVVVRWVHDTHVGVQFAGLRAKETWALHQLMKPR